MPTTFQPIIKTSLRRSRNNMGRPGKGYHVFPHVPQERTAPVGITAHISQIYNGVDRRILDALTAGKNRPEIRKIPIRIRRLSEIKKIQDGAGLSYSISLVNQNKPDTSPKDSQTSLGLSSIDKQELPIFRRTPVLSFSYQEKSVQHVLARLERESIQESSFRSFLNELESVPLEQYASQVCDKLFLVVERNLNLTEEQSGESVSEERVALGSAIRKLVFNLTDASFPQIVKLLEKAEEYRTEKNATPVEKLLYKSLVDRFEFRPQLRDIKMELIADRCRRTVIQFGTGVATKTKTTKAVLLNAILGFACYATADQPPKYSRRLDLPGSLCLLLDTMGKDMQNAITRKISEDKLRPNVLPFIKRLMKK